jgi:hypothetical protein
MSYVDDYWKQETDRAETAAVEAFEKTESRYHFDDKRMLGETMRVLKGKCHPQVVHEVVLKKVEEKKVELRRVVQQQLQYIIDGPLGLLISSKQDVESLRRSLITRVYENANRNVSYVVLQEIVDAAVADCLKANNIHYA